MDPFGGGITNSHNGGPKKIPLTPMNKAMLRIEHSKALNAQQKEIAYYMINHITWRIRLVSHLTRKKTDER